MGTAEDLQRQIREAEELKRRAEKARLEERSEIQRQMGDLDNKISELQSRKAELARDLGKLA